MVSIRHNEAKVLSLLLENAERVVSKDEILNLVWKEKVVSDQAVFQNISHLRALFGTSAIKTFSKRGYQWQLPIAVIPPSPSLTSLPCNALENEYIEHCVAPEKTVNKAENAKQLQSKVIQISNANMPFTKRLACLTTNSLKRIFNQTSPFVLLIIILFTSIVTTISWKKFSHSKASNSYSTKILVPPFRDEHSTKRLDAIMQYWLNSNEFSVLENREFNNQSIFDSPFQTWQTVAGNNESLLFGYKFHLLNTRGSEILFRFYLQGEFRGWEGYIVAESPEALSQKFSKLLTPLISSGYFSLNSFNAALSQITLLHNANPEDPIIALQLIKMYTEIEELELAANLVTLQDKADLQPIYKGLLNLAKADIASKLGQWPQSGEAANEAMKIFKDLEQLNLESKALTQMAWSAFVAQDYRQSSEYLNTAANKARLAAEPLQEVKAHLTQSFMAAKINQKALEHSHLNLAQQLLELHQLNEEHQIGVLSNLAWSAKNKTEKLEYYLRILDVNYYPLYKNDFYVAAEHAREALLEKKDYEATMATIKPWQRSSFAMLTRAKISIARKRWKEGEQLSMLTYTSARMANEIYDALDAALLILDNKNHLSETIKSEELIQFIEQNSTVRWKRMNKNKLFELGYWN